MALGAERVDVLRLVLKEGLVMALGGVALGLAGAAMLSRSMATLLFGVTARDPLTFAAGGVRAVPRCAARQLHPRAARHSGGAGNCASG
jgi:ABC-type antimicrobial peptide transport system permease subunit